MGRGAGDRVLLGGRVVLESRNLLDVTPQYPELRAIGRQLGSREAVLDGEIVALDEAGDPSFQLLQRRMHLASDSEIRRRAKQVPVTYMVFDLLYAEGRTTMELTYEERRSRLEALELEGPNWQTPSYHRGEGKALLDASRERGLEGIVAKRLDSPYLPGKRTTAWVKVKNVRSQELVIGDGSRQGQARGRDRRSAGRLLRARRRRAAASLRRQGGDRVHRRVAAPAGEADGAADRDESPFAAGRVPRDAVFVEPRLVAEVEFNEWTGRHPAPSIFKGLRDDKEPTEVIREEPASKR